ncbi:hypothetical protein [Chachezhania antarctica]|uniref:hypothetical protein n=1 Tax=Chachezhania antarctica TaxID=2340860 RepID=UPI000EAE020D|nr:hypothetical protein [Chachezhania antarctica]
MRRKLADFGDLTPAEQKVRDGIGLGRGVLVGLGRPTATAGEDRQIRGEFIRYLMLGGCEGLEYPVHEIGVAIIGARVTDELDLYGAKCRCDLSLYNCHFDDAPTLNSSEIGGLYLDGSAVPGLEAQRLITRGGVHLRARAETSFQATGTIDLTGAHIGDNLDCSGAKLLGAEGADALIAERARISGSLLLNADGPLAFKAQGMISLVGAEIGSQLCCVGAELSAAPDSWALQADSVRVLGGFFLKDGTKVDGVLDLSNAELGAINDTDDSWPQKGNLVLDRCRYGAFMGKDVSAKARIRWLGLQDWSKFDKDFWPQPWEQCAKVLREMGHGEDACRVLIDKERRQRQWRRQKVGTIERRILWLGDMLMAVTTRYGRRPLLAFAWLAAIWLIGCGVFFAAAQHDAIKPNNPFVLRSPEWTACRDSYTTTDGMLSARPEAAPAESQLDCFLQQPEAKSYPVFNHWIYSADTLLPIVAMEMQEFWIPDETQGWVGRYARYYLWVQIALGWALSLLAVAGFSGLIKTDNT